MRSWEGRAEEILALVRKKDRPLAVFKTAKSFKTSPVDAALNDQIKSRFFVGVYDKNCPLEWLEADLAHASEG
jgi:hypothetical protein